VKEKNIDEKKKARIPSGPLNLFLSLRKEKH